MNVSEHSKTQDWVTYTADVRHGGHHAIGLHGVPRASCIRPLEQVVILDHKVVEQLDAQIALGLDVVLDVDQSIYFDVDSEAVGRELSRDFLVDLNEHIM